MLWLIVVVLLVIAFGGFGHTGYRRGWYGGYADYGQSRPGGWFGGLFGVVLLVAALFLLFGRHRFHHYGHW